ncbi:MAG: 30S ribosomal protein S6 [Candidatus Neomarinimicrobiota bacterium]|nr:30S ribosomal protein S6 [Candidatus Neomarinimicrobiota bacterium]
MRYFETLYIVNSNLEGDVLNKTMNEIGVELEKTKSKLINHRVWGKKRLAYPIDKQKYGSFILMQFQGGEFGKMNEFDTWMKLNGSILRHMTVRLSEKPEVYVEEEKPENNKIVATTSEPAEEITSEEIKVKTLVESSDEVQSDPVKDKKTDEDDSSSQEINDGTEHSIKKEEAK